MGRMTAEEAKTKYQELLDILADSYRNQDFEAFSSVVHTPHHITTPHETITIRESHQLEAVFKAVCGIIHVQEDVEINCYCHAAKPRGRDRIDGEYSTEVSDDHPLLPPSLQSKTVLMWIGGKWVGCVSHYAFSKDDVVVSALREAVKH